MIDCLDYYKIKDSIAVNVTSPFQATVMRAGREEPLLIVGEIREVPVVEPLPLGDHQRICLKFKLWQKQTQNKHCQDQTALI